MFITKIRGIYPFPIFRGPTVRGGGFTPQAPGRINGRFRQKSANWVR